MLVPSLYYPSLRRREGPPAGGQSCFLEPIAGFEFAPFDVHGSDVVERRTSGIESLVNLRNTIAVVLATALGILLIAAAETVQVAMADGGAGAPLLLSVYLQVVAYELRFLAGPIIFQMGLAVIAAFEADSGPRWWVRAGALTAMAAAAVYLSYTVLTEYEAFQDYPLFIAAYTCLFIFLTTGAATLGARRGKRAVHKALRTCVVVIGSGGAVAVYVLNYYMYKGYYPTLHLSSMQVTMLMLHLGTASWMVPAINRTSTRKCRAVLCIVPLLLLFIGSSAAAVFSGAVSTGRPSFLSYSIVGQSLVVTRLFVEDTELEQIELVPDLGAKDRFEKYNRLPELPDDFSLKDYNILLVTIESTRFDQTSLSSPTLGTTPHLVRIRDSGAFCFTRAYSPSSGTLHSMSSLHTMTYPTMAPQDTWRKAWEGELRPEALTVAEILSDAGFKTHWVSHNYGGGFEKGIIGLGQGFSKVSFCRAGPKGPADADRTIAKKAIAALSKLAASEGSFYAWVFFVSPHGKYLAHYGDMPDESDLDRYRQEVRYSDEQLGRVWASLEKSGLLETTIVIISGDHGEEFREHGGVRHKSTVYSEVTRVPLLVWLPWMKGHTIDEPMSLMYIFPWLLSGGGPGIEEHADERISQDIGPMLKYTEGAVVIELTGRDRMMSSLVYDTYKVNYDFFSGLHELYNVKTDPLEQHNLFRAIPDAASKYVELMTGYRQVRAARAQFKILPKKKRETKQKKAKKKKAKKKKTKQKKTKQKAAGKRATTKKAESAPSTE